MKLVAIVCLALLAAANGAVVSHAQADPLPVAAPRFVTDGERLRGSQLLADAAFDLVDWNDDGILDFYLPWTSMNTAMVLVNHGTKTEPRLGHAQWYPLNITETLPYPLYFTQAQILGDLNSDGLWDMIYYDGQFRMAYNVGTRHGPNHWHLAGADPHFPGSPQMRRENTRFTAVPESMYFGKGVFPRQVLTATVADWDGDGLVDLIVCRFKAEAPGIAPATRDLPLLPSSIAERPTALEHLDAAPAREMYFYKNVGTKTEPFFDKGVELTTPDGRSIAAPNPVVVDLDGDGVLDIVSTETPYRCNAYRVDWPTNPHVVWFKRAKKEEVGRLAAAQPVVDAAGKPIPSGVQVRLADYRGVGVRDMFVLDPNSGLRWYQNQAKAGSPAFATATRLAGTDFARFGMMYQPLVADWFAAGSRDLVLHGELDMHCRWGLRRTALYRNVATKPGKIQYEFVGNFNYQGDPTMIPQAPPYQDTEDAFFGSKVAVLPPDSHGSKRLVMSVDGRLYLFRKLAADGLTFQERVPLNIPNPGRNRHTGWQEIPVAAPGKVRFIRINSAPSSTGGNRDGLLHIVNFEALAGGKNVAALDQGAELRVNPIGSPTPKAMLTPGNRMNDAQVSFSSFGGGEVGPAVIVLKEPVTLDKIRFLLSDRQKTWYTWLEPFSWQGKRIRQSPELGTAWFNYKIEVSADEKNWTVLADTLMSEMNRSTPVFVDWNQDGKLDLVLGVLNQRGVTPHETEYRLYLNQGSNDEPKYVAYLPFGDETGAPLRLRAVNQFVPSQCDLALLDRQGDGRRYDLVVEDYETSNSLRYYQNVATDPQRELKYKFIKLLGDDRPIAYKGPYRSFTMADADGDGVVDILQFTGGCFFFRGLAPGAPATITNLTVVGVNQQSVEVQWTKPTGASRYELRYSRPSPELTESEWLDLPVVTGDYTVADGQTQNARVTLPADGQVWAIAAKSASAKGELSARSDSVDAIAAPWQRVVLRNGPAGAFGVPAYAGAQGGMISAEYPTKTVGEQALKLQVYLHRDNKPAMLLIRFQALPQLAGLQRATLELTTDPSLLARPWNRMAGQLDLTCNMIRNDWDAKTASFAEVVAGQSWVPDELRRGGKFLAMDRQTGSVKARYVLRWDVTAAVRDALQAGRNSVSLLVRPEFNGPYSHDEEYSFCGMEFPQTELRPRLVLLGQN